MAVRHQLKHDTPTPIHTVETVVNIRNILTDDYDGPIHNEYQELIKQTLPPHSDPRVVKLSPG
jgi:hypothetical protein